MTATNKITGTACEIGSHQNSKNYEPIKRIVRLLPDRPATHDRASRPAVSAAQTQTDPANHSGWMGKKKNSLDSRHLVEVMEGMSRRKPLGLVDDIGPTSPAVPPRVPIRPGN